VGIVNGASASPARRRCAAGGEAPAWSAPVREEIALIHYLDLAQDRSTRRLSNHQPQIARCDSASCICRKSAGEFFL
jgi:hypothetical protein